jgi:hypothetical protein
VAETATKQLGLSNGADAELLPDDAPTIPGMMQVALKHLNSEHAPAAVEALKGLVELHERVTARNAAAEFAQAMAKFQEECPQITRATTGKVTTKSGSQYSYQYAELDTIDKTIKPIMTKHGLSKSFDCRKEGELMMVICTVRHVMGHSESSTFPVPVESTGGMSPQQKYSAAWTTGRRQALIQIMGLTTTGDPDPDGADPRGLEKITKNQVCTLSTFISEVDANEEKFLKFMGVDCLDDILVRDYQKAVDALERKRQKQGVSE